jgi:hypothetical protein
MFYQDHTYKHLWKNNSGTKTKSSQIKVIIRFDQQTFPQNTKL